MPKSVHWHFIDFLNFQPFLCIHVIDTSIHMYVLGIKGLNFIIIIDDVQIAFIAFRPNRFLRTKVSNWIIGLKSSVVYMTISFYVFVMYIVSTCGFELNEYFRINTRKKSFHFIAEVETLTNNRFWLRFYSSGFYFLSFYTNFMLSDNKSWLQTDFRERERERWKTRYFSHHIYSKLQLMILLPSWR